MRLAAAAAPNPLSILTTVTPEAHELSIPSSAAMPPNEAPYPTLVGTAITGTGTSPPTTLGSAPSIPATTMITAALRSSSVWVRMRWMPATPTSVSRATRLRSARAVTAASSATGRSLVPAVTIRIVPRPVGSGSGSGGRYTVRPSSPTSALGNRTARAARCGGSARVARRLPAPATPFVYQPKCLRNSSAVLRVSPWSVSARRACSSATANRSAAVGAGRAPGDHDAGAVRVAPHGDHVGRGRDVAVADHRNVERFHHAGDLVPVRLP